MMCENCERHVKEALEALPFIESAKADHVQGTVDITSDGEPDRKAMEDAISKAGYTLKDEPSTEGKATVLVGGMMCENCEKHVKKALNLCRSSKAPVPIIRPGVWPLLTAHNP